MRATVSLGTAESSLSLRVATASAYMWTHTMHGVRMREAQGRLWVSISEEDVNLWWTGFLRLWSLWRHHLPYEKDKSSTRSAQGTQEDREGSCAGNSGRQTGKLK